MGDTERVPRPNPQESIPTQHVELSSGSLERETMSGTDDTMAALDAYLGKVERSGIASIQEDALEAKARKLESVIARIAELEHEPNTEENDAEMASLQTEEWDLRHDLEALKGGIKESLKKKENSQIISIREELGLADTGTDSAYGGRGGDTEPAPPRVRPQQSAGRRLIKKLFGL